MDTPTLQPPETIICCWSGPRCVSTSLMYSFAQRPDCQVLDEPLYAAFLKLTNVERPYTDLVMASQNPDGNAVVQDILNTPRLKPVLYVKLMAKQRITIDKKLLSDPRTKHILLVRNPMAVVSSFSEVVEPTLMETCYTSLLELYSELRQLDKTPPIILSDDLVQHPESTLRLLCAAVNIPFTESMLSWPKGPKPDIDGVWAPWWYTRTHESTGFQAAVSEGATGFQATASGGGSGSTSNPAAVIKKNENLKMLLQECWPLWDVLKQKALSLQTTTASIFPTENDVIHDSLQTGTHAHAEDPRNNDILIGIRNGVTNSFELVPRLHAKVSVFESGYMLGDGVWEGLRIRNGAILFAKKHFDRLFEGAKAIDMAIGVSPQELQQLVYDTLAGNGMAKSGRQRRREEERRGDEGVHVRLMVTRGVKSTCYQNPKVTIGLPTVVIIPEYKKAAEKPKTEGIKLFTCHVRRSRPDTQDPNLNSHSKLNCIAACIQANKAGADEGLMLDPEGFVCTCNSVNFFIVRSGGEVWTATTKYLMPGITRGNVVELCSANGITIRELDFSLTQVYGAEGAFVTGTFGGITPVSEIDGRQIPSSSCETISRLQALYEELCAENATRGRIVL